VKLDGYLGPDLAGAGDQAAELEGLGYDGVFTAEGPHEPFLGLAVAAARTRRVELLSNIAVAFARSPLDLAQLADGLQRLSGGRFLLGVGSQIRPHIEKRFSMPWSRPAARMRELVLAVKAIQRCWQDGSPLDFQGQFYGHTLMTPFFSPGPNPAGPPPVLVAALGPRLTEVAGEVGDGLLIHPFHSGQYVREHAVPAVERGMAAAGGRDRVTFIRAATVIVATGGDDATLARAEDGIRRLLAFYGSTPAYRVVLEAHGWGELQTELNRLSKQGRWSEMAAQVPDEVVDALVVRAPPSRVAAAIADRYAGALDRVSLSMPYEVPAGVRAEVVDGFRALQQA
jgi:probable F420-dependent oxidoreductase